MADRIAFGKDSQMKLSVIICVYNTPRNYLEACLDSITRSTVRTLGDDFEICLVDDGSREDYTDLAEKYGTRVTKTENRGIFSARKTGAEMARGRYSVFCDSDDTVSFDYYLPMLEKAEAEGADIVINGWATHSGEARYYPKRDGTMCENIDVSGDKTLLSFVKNEGRQHSFYVLWNKLYRTELLLSAFDSLCRAGYSESSSYSEDAALNFFLWRDAGRIVNISTGFYFYRIHSEQSVTVASEEKLRRQIDSMAQTLDIMRKNVGANPQRTEILSHIAEWEALMARTHYSQAKSAGYKELFPYVKEKYGIEKLSGYTLKDGACYRSNVLLGSNFEEVDRALLAVYNAPSPVRCRYSKRDTYTARAVSALKRLRRITDEKSAPEISVPRFKITLRKRILHNALVYRIGAILFKKGSRLRAFLKKFV